MTAGHDTRKLLARGLPLGAALVLVFAACGPAAQDPGPDSSGCEPGTTITCACTNGSSGVQQCDALGVYGQCAGCGMTAGVPPAGGEMPPPVAVDPAPTDPMTNPTPSEPTPSEPTPTEPVPTEPAPTDPVVEPPPPPVEEPPPPPPNTDQTQVPATPHCAPVSDWDPLWTQWEDEVLLLVNERRAQGASCGSQGSFPAAAPLTMNPYLRCSSRLHSLDMANRSYFDHTNPDGDDPFDRMQDAGYSGGTMGENIAAGQSSPQAVVSGWMGSDGHCANIMRGGFTEIGVGYYASEGGGFGGRGYGHYWTQNFGGPGRRF